MLNPCAMLVYLVCWKHWRRSSKLMLLRLDCAQHLDWHRWQLGNCRHAHEDQSNEAGISSDRVSRALAFFLRSRSCSWLAVGGLVDGHTSAHQMWWSSLTQREHRTWQEIDCSWRREHTECNDKRCEKTCTKKHAQKNMHKKTGTKARQLPETVPGSTAGDSALSYDWFG